MFQTSKDYYDFVQKIYDSLIGGGSVAKARKTLAKEHFEIRRHCYMQCSNSFIDETGRSRTCQWNPQTIFIQRMDEDYEGFQYEYSPTKGELIELLEGVIKYSTFKWGLDLDVEPEVF